jgi:hypothetical protein
MSIICLFVQRISPLHYCRVWYINLNTIFIVFFLIKYARQINHEQVVHDKEEIHVAISYGFSGNEKLTSRRLRDLQFS